MMKPEDFQKKFSEKKHELIYLNGKIDELWDAPPTELIIEERIKMTQRLMKAWGSITGMMRVWYDSEDYMLELDKIEKEIRSIFRKPVTSNMDYVEIDITTK